MRALLWGLALFAAAVGLVAAARYNSGYVLIVLPPWRAELSFNFAVILLLVVLVAAYAVVRTVAITMTMPARVHAFQRRRAESRARATFNDALVNYFEGRFGRAEKAAAAALKAGESPGLSAVLAARAAHGMRAFAARDKYLARSAGAAAGDEAIKLMAQAEMLLDERRYYDALDVLRKLPEKHTAALRLELRAQQMARNWERVLALIPLLEKRRVFERPVMAQLHRQAVIEGLKRKAVDERSLREYWGRLGTEDRRDARVAATAAQAFADLAGCAEAHRIVEEGLEHQWDPALLAIYSQCPAADARRQLERAEDWLREHPRDAVLLLTLGRLCAQQGLWGKARSYLEASLSVEATHSAHLELGRLLEREGKPTEAAAEYQKALAVTLEQLKHHGGGRRRPLV
ncbi:MAG TPA: heme biosynthesis HemY N-terminal domain-containing protein [Burkholderiales bacterium]|nr:heme biosynthesis HemY N-terminal domain-containing protein [Burkholderiales bacterium]